MIKVIGQTGCKKCEMTKVILKDKNIDFKYNLLDKLDVKTRVKYIHMAQKAGQLELPLIIKNGKLVDINIILNENNE